MSITAINYVNQLVQVKGTPRAVLRALADRMNEQTRRCNPSHQDLAAMTGRHRATVIRAIKKLETDGIIAVRHCRRHGNRYVINGLPAVSSKSHSATSDVATCDIRSSTLRHESERIRKESNTSASGGGFTRKQAFEIVRAARMLDERFPAPGTARSTRARSLVEDLTDHSWAHS